jgi:hypothetical protein
MATGHEGNQQSGNAQGTTQGTTQGAAGGQTGPGWDALKEDVGEMAETAMEQGRHIFDSAREQATGYVDQRKDQLAQSVADLANTLRQSGGGFDQPSIRAVVESAAGGLEQVAENIRARSFGDMVDNVETMVRRRPAVAAVATMTVGFLLARFVKASSEAAARSAGRPSRPSGGAGQWQPHGMPGSNLPSSGQAGT